jgi:hypothetical protein
MVSRKAALWLSLTVILLFGVAMAILEIQVNKPKVWPPIDENAAREVLDRTVRLARDRQYEAICREIPDYPNLCKQLLDGAGHPGQDAPAVVGVTGAGSSRVMLRLEGKRADGTPYDADFEVRWASIKGKDRLVANYPIYWSGVSIADPQPCATVRENEACAEATVVIPPPTS